MLPGDHRMLSGVLPAPCSHSFYSGSYPFHFLHKLFLFVAYSHYCAIFYVLAHPVILPWESIPKAQIWPCHSPIKTTNLGLHIPIPSTDSQIFLQFSLICLFSSNCKEQWTWISLLQEQNSFEAAKFTLILCSSKLGFNIKTMT